MSQFTRSSWLALAFAALIIVPSLISIPVHSQEMPAPDPAHGEEVYETFCEACHNEHGIVGPPLIEEAGHLVRAGVPAGLVGPLLQKPVRTKGEESVMPSFTPDQVSDADLNDIGAYLMSFEPVPETPLQMGSAENGTGLYAQHCGICHGAAGEGVNGMTPVALMAAELKQYNMPESVMLGFVLMSSRVGDQRGMPAWGEDALSDQDLCDIAAYIWDMPVPDMPVQE